jgi:hypothetical protein
LVDFHELWYRGNATEGDFDAVIFNPISSTILRGSKLLVGGTIFSLAQQWFEIV